MNQEQAPTPTTTTGPGSRKRRTLFFAVWASLFVLILLVFRGVLLPFLLAVVVAYVLAPLVRHLEQYAPRWVGVVGLYAVLVGIISILSVTGIPRLAAELESLAQEAPRAVATAQTKWLPWITGQVESAMTEYGHQRDKMTKVDATNEVSGASLPGQPRVTGQTTSDGIRFKVDGEGGYVLALPRDGIRIVDRGDGVYSVSTAKQRSESGDIVDVLEDAFRGLLDNTRSHAAAIFRTAQGVVRAVVKGLFTFVITLMLSAYLLATSDRIFGFFRTLVRVDRRANFDTLLSMIDRGLSGVVRGQLFIALINGMLSGVAFFLLDLRYWPILMLVATLLSVVPIFGAILSSIPAVIIALEQGVMTAGITLLVIVGIHQVEANLLNPKIMGDAAKVHPVLVVFALLAGEHLFGIAGALLAVPVLSITQSLFLYSKTHALAEISS